MSKWTSHTDIVLIAISLAALINSRNSKNDQTKTVILEADFWS